jgi:hypothetical protein
LGSMSAKAVSRTLMKLTHGERGREREITRNEIKTNGDPHKRGRNFELEKVFSFP